VALTTKERQAVLRELGKGYRKKTKKERGLIVDELVRLTGYNRAHACRALRQAEFVGKGKPRPRSRAKTYGPEVLLPLRAYSTPNRSAIPRDADHLIHAMPISQYAPWRSAIPRHADQLSAGPWNR
jgi:hypothetical protein